MGVIEDAVAWAIETANDQSHGYSQADRWGPDYDCSSFVISAFEQAGVSLREAGASYTGNMRGPMISCGFVDVTYSIGLDSGYGLQPGDVLLNYAAHTCICIGGGKVANCRTDEGHPQSGDQSGNEIRIQSYWNFPWDCVLRYQEKDEKPVDPVPAPEPTDKERTYTVKPGDSLWGIAEREMGNGMLYEELKRYNNLHDYTIYPGQVLKIRDAGNCWSCWSRHSMKWDGPRSC